MAKKPAVVNIDIDMVEQHPENPRVHDLDAIAASLEKFGQTKPIIVQKDTNYVVAGNGTRLAAKRLGWTTIDARIVDFDDEKAKAYLAADNRTSDRARYDSERLLGLLEGLEDLDGTGYDADDLDDLAGAKIVDHDTGEVKKMAAPESSKPRAESEAAKAEPLRDIVMLMTVSRAQAFGEKVRALQKHYGTATVVDTVERAIDEATKGL